MDHTRHARLVLTVLGALGVLAAQPAAGPQEVRVSSWTYVPPAAPTVRVESKLVDVGVVVRDHYGRPVPGLTQNDFKIYDNGKERAITAFSMDTSRAAAAAAIPAQREGKPAASITAAPANETPAKPTRYLALVFDDVNIKDSDLMHVRAAARHFVQEALQPQDRVAIFTTSRGKVLDFTSDAPKMLEVIEKLASHLRMSENGLMPCPRITPYQAYLIVNQDPDALTAAVDEARNCTGGPGGTTGNPFNDPMIRTVRVQAEQTWDQARAISQSTLDAIERVVGQLAEMPGNRVLLLASSGFLAETLEYEQNRIIDETLRAGIVVNALDAKGLFGESAIRTFDQTKDLVGLPTRSILFEAARLGQQLQTVLAPIAYLAQSTGGLFFHDSNDLTLGFEELGAAPEVSYRLAFRPDDVADKRYHKLKVKIAGKKPYLVQSRPGYVAAALAASPQVEQASSAPQRRLDRELMGSDTLADVPAGVTAQPGTSKTGQPLLWLLVHIDLKRLSFSRQNDRQEQRITFLTGLLDEKGNLVAAKESRMDLDLSEPTFERLSASGINAKLSLEAPPGAYRLRSIVEEGLEGKMAASTQPVEIH